MEKVYNVKWFTYSDDMELQWKGKIPLIGQSNTPTVYSTLALDFCGLFPFVLVQMTILKVK